MFCNLCNNNSTNFNNNSSCGCGNNRCGCGCNNNNGCGCNSRNNANGLSNNGSGCGCGNNNCGCGCNGQRSNGGCGWYTCPCSGTNNFFWMPSNGNSPVQPTTPALNLGAFGASTATVEPQATIPLSLTTQIGTQITSSGTGALVPAGTYEVSYALSGTPTPTTAAADGDDEAAQPTPSNGIATVGIKLNGVTQPSFTQSASTTTNTQPYNISSQGLLTVSAPNSIITLVNLSAREQTFTEPNLVVRKI